MKNCLVFFCLILCAFNMQSQPVPGIEENIPFLVTFGKKADTKWGDPDFSQIWFFLVPESYTGSVYIRIFDPDVGGMHDEQNGAFDTKTTFTLYGGKGAYPPNPEAQQAYVYPKGNIKTGTVLVSRTFGVDPKLDDSWYSFGPWDPKQGDHYPQYGGYIFKLVAEGVDGDDGNLYRYFMSTSGNENIPIEGGNAFAFEYKFRLHDNPKEVSHIYPFVDIDDTKIRTGNFDWDSDGKIRVTSEVRREQLCNPSGDNKWEWTEFSVWDGEKGKSLDFQFIKSPAGIKKNNVVINVRNQKGELLKFYSSPIGGVPRYKYVPEVRKKNN